MSKELLQKVIDKGVEGHLNEFFQNVSKYYTELEDDLSEHDGGGFSGFQAIGEINFSPVEKLVVITANIAGDLTERSGKKAQYEKAKRILRQYMRYDVGIFVFSDSAGNFRLSLVYGTPDATRLVWSNFRRFTYFVSSNEPYRTFLTRVGGCDYSNIDNIKEAFSVEKVTRDFYTEYNRIFKDVESLIQGFDNSKEGFERKRLFTQTLFNRLMFIAFIEKKGWLKYNSQTDYLFSLWKDYKSKSSAENSFYHDRLIILFFAGLNTTNDVNIADTNKNGILNNLIGDVPYLNGGLFEENDDDRDPEIVIPDQCFGSIIEDLFKRFNFTVTENTPLDIEVAVDPEMLGKVFEELVTGRHKTGSYYTPKTVVSFMCREALKGYLGGYEKLIDNNDVSNINVTEARELISKLKHITSCDPACGSGAYLVGMLHELKYLHRLLDTRAAEMTARDDYQLKLEIIQNNLYGVDIDSFAVNIARLRLWLSLSVEYDGNKPEPLPNLDFKIEIGDSLVSPNPQETGDVGFRAEYVNRFKEKKEEYLNTHEPGPKHKLRKEILDIRREIIEWTHPEQKTYTYGFDWAVDFVEVFDNGGFDVVIANPPYGLSCEDPLRFQYFPRKKSEDAQSKDSYGLFMARALQLLKQGGFFTFIVSDTWRTIRSHRPLRSKLLQETCVEHIIDLPSWIFQATVNTCILSLRKQIPDDKHTLITVDLHNLPNNDWQTLEANFYATATHIPDVQTITYARYTYPQNLILTYENLSFFIGSPSMYKLMSDKRFAKLGSEADVKVGLQTGDNEYYIRKRAGARGNHKIVNGNKLLTQKEILSLTTSEKTSGVNPVDYNGRHFIPYDKGGESDSEDGWVPNYNVPTQYYMDWSNDAVCRLQKATIADVKRRKGQEDKINPHDENHIASRFQNVGYYFKDGITFSDTGIYSPSFRQSAGSVFDQKGSIIIPEDSTMRDVLVGLLCSIWARYVYKTYVNHTVSSHVDSIKEFPCPLDFGKAEPLTELVLSIVEKQKSDQRYQYHLYEQKEIDNLVYQLYGLNDEDIREIELWYSRRYPRLAKAQGIFKEVQNKYASYLKKCELILSKHPDYWNTHPTLRLIAQGESPKMEFKESLEADSNTGQKNPGVLLSSLKTIAAFLNTNGGTLLIGVSDNGNIVGLEKDYQLCNKHDRDGLEQKIRSLLTSHFQPNPIGKVDIKFENLPDGGVCKIDVRSDVKIYHLGTKDVYIRDGNTTRKLEGPTLVNWIQNRNASS